MSEKKVVEHSSVFNPRKLSEYTEGGIVSQQLVKNSAGNISLFAFDKGQNLSEHSAPFDAMVQVLEGTGEYIIGGKSHQVNAGEMIIMPANVPHAVKAVTPFKMILVMIKGN